jgi:cyclopropane-fatty-acyl-phospholipid synthase
VTAVSNSRGQAREIAERAAARGLRNVRAVTADMNELELADRFDRVLSVEMLEHMRNYERLLARIAGWMRDDALLFLHLFAHARFAYLYEDRGVSDWMAREFFTGGMMPSASLLLHFQQDLRLREQWAISGDHYRKTAEAWLANLLRRSDEVTDILVAQHGPADAARWFARWRLFFLACAEMFGYHGGSEWIVAHYLFEKP